MRKLYNVEKKVNYVKEMAEKYNISYMEALETLKFIYHIEDMAEIKSALNWLRDR